MKTVGNLFKIIFAIFIFICLAMIIIATIFLVEDSRPGSIPLFLFSPLSPFIIAACILAIILYGMKKRKTKNQSDPTDRAGATTLVEKPKEPGANSNDNRFEGLGAIVELGHSSITISRHGVASFLTQGIKGEKTIPLQSLTAIQFKDAQKSMSGYIQFSIKGEIASRGGIWDAALDENTVMFTYEQSAMFKELREKVEASMTISKPAPIMGVNSFADELTKLADLRDRGVLDESEFQSQKARLVA